MERVHGAKQLLDCTIQLRLGAQTRVQGPPPAGQSQGAIQTFSYDSARRLQQATTTYNGAYQRYAYGANYVQSYSTVNSVADEAYAIQVFDGLGRLIAAVGNHPGSSGGYRAVITVYDLMGRPIRQSNPTETGGWPWTPTGDDATGWIYTEQTYDWKGRPLVTTHLTDGTQKYASYSACGCAGSEVATLTDERGRQQKIYSDVLGRTSKTEVLNWNGTVYSTTVNSYNARDQVTLVRQYQGADTSGVYQDTTMNYDGHGRLQSQHLPEQNSGTATVYSYNSDDTVYSVTDARGASATYSYNNRHLVTGITYSAPSGITVPAAASFGYDAAGNRTSMSDGAGTSSYSYDQLSRMTSETRTFTGLSGSYELDYSYNLANELTSLSIPFNSQQIGYSYDTSGRLAGVSASGFSATYNVWPNSYTQTITSFASNITYRAWGGRKSMTYGNTVSDSVAYNSRLQPTSYTVNNTNYTNYTVSGYPNYSSMSWTYDYYNDGRLNHAWDSTNNWFDRSYSYDHAARVSEASTYRRAEGLSPAPAVPYTDPYHQLMSYDVWGNITNRSGSLYGGDQNDTASYANNRRQYWSYDANGNATTDSSYNHGFDAAGKNGHAASLGTILMGGQYQPILDITQTYDGDGQARKRVQVSWQNGICCDEYGNPGEPFENTETSYYVRSTVLGGAMIADVGQGEVWVYAAGQRIAKAKFGDVTFEHHNPLTGSWVTTHGHSSYRTTLRQERDPMGAELPLSTPYGGQSSYVNSKWGELLFIDGGDPFDYSSGLSIDGMPVSASEFARRTGNGSVAAGVFFNGRQIGFADLTGRSSLNHITVTFDVFLVNGADRELPEYLVDSFAADFSLPSTGNPANPQRLRQQPPTSLAQQRADQAVDDCRVKAMLDAIAWAEGTADDADGGYGRVVRGTVLRAPHNPELVGQVNVTITDFTRHPNILVQVREGLNSTAAGRYQFLNRTWTGLGLEDFGTRNQDIGAVMLLQQEGAMNSLEAGDIERAVSLARDQWASLPNSPYGQPTRAMADFQTAYDNALAGCRARTIRIR